MMKKILATISILLAGLSIAQAKDYKLLSPSGNIQITVSEGKSLTWSVKAGDEVLLAPSELALEVRGKGVLGPGAKARKASRKSIDEIQTAVVPVKARTIRNRCNELTLSFGLWAVRFRAYDNGVAYRFETSMKGNIEVLGETSEWNLQPGCHAFWANETNPDYITHCEADFRDLPICNIAAEKYSYLPVSLATPSGVRAVITESDLSDYPNMMLRAGYGDCLKAEYPHVIDAYELKNDRDVRITSLADCIARTRGTRTFPWRLMTIGTDAELLENTLSWQLASKEDDRDWSWLKPGKISWEWWAALNVYGVDFVAGVNTETYKYYIDFAAEYGLEYILLDEGWSASTLNIKEPNPALDLQGLISYGKSKGVGVVLWTLWTPMLADMENILDIYQEWGVEGIKVDFMQMQDQNMMNFYEKLAAECAKRHLVVDYHGAFKPAGIQLKYPNAMTYDGVYGQEHDKCSYDISPEHDMQLPFTRMVAGPMDYTPGATNNATKDDFAIRWNHPMSQGTRSHQAALFVVFESPLEMLCDSPSNYYKVPEFTSFLAQVPTVWEETVAQEAVAGDYLLMSRRAADGRWFSAGLTDWDERDLVLDTSFLGEGEWTVLIHRDGVNADKWAEDYKLETIEVKAGDSIPVHMAKGGGWAAIFTRK